MNRKAGQLILLRRIFQTSSVLLMFYIIWNTHYPLDKFINPSIYFKLDPLLMFSTSIALRLILPGIIYSVFVIIFTVVLSRVFCGWFCPMGALLDFTDAFKSKLLKKFIKKPKEHEPGKLKFLKYFILGILLFFSIFGIQLSWLLDPLAITFRAVSLNIHPIINNTIDNFLVKILQITGAPEFIENIYNILKDTILIASDTGLPHEGLILGIFAVILVSSVYKRRLWCRYLCPLGALLAIPAGFSLLKRKVNICRDNCGNCKNICRMNAIKEDNSYHPEECIVCLDCVKKCPAQGTEFSFKKNKPDEVNTDGVSRNEFLVFFLSVIYLLFKGRSGLTAPAMESKQFKKNIELLRPPGGLKEEDFINQCVRCGNCIKVCPNNVIQPVTFQKGLHELWTPYLNGNKGYCEYECNLCGQVCPTGAIRDLELDDKKKFKIGIAKINRELCIPYAKGENCIVCEEHCPVSEKAIKLKKKIVKGKLIYLPIVDAELCTGCLICENKCPTMPDRAIKVEVTKLTE